MSTPAMQELYLPLSLEVETFRRQSSIGRRRGLGDRPGVIVLLARNRLLCLLNLPRIHSKEVVACTSSCAYAVRGFQRIYIQSPSIALSLLSIFLRCINYSTRMLIMHHPNLSTRSHNPYLWLLFVSFISPILMIIACCRHRLYC